MHSLFNDTILFKEIIWNMYKVSIKEFMQSPVEFEYIIFATQQHILVPNM
jgi:hypothetical protein